VKNLLSFFFTIITLSTINAQNFTSHESYWVDSVFKTLTIDDKIGQLIIVRAHSDKGPEHIADVEKLVQKNKVGGLCFFQGTPEKQAELTNRYQHLSNVPLLVSTDAEWGLNMRLKSTVTSLPMMMMLGAITDNELIYEYGKELARQCKRIGVQLNYAPVVDINNNPDNPVINERSFGENTENVAAKSFMIMKGMQDGGILACAKHFPGHGDTNVDSHFDLPIINHTMKELDSTELVPFRVVSQLGISSIMVAHLSVPSIDPKPKTPTTLSSRTINGLLKDEIGFNGLVITDGLEMKGVTKYFKAGEVEATAIMSGNDILLLPESTPAAVSKIKEFIADGRISQSKLDESVLKVLHAKYSMGLFNRPNVIEQNIREELNSPELKNLKRKLVKAALTLVKNKNGIIPLNENNNYTIAALSIGSGSTTPFQNTLKNYAAMKLYNVDKELSAKEHSYLMNNLQNMGLVIISLHDMNPNAKKGYGLTESEKLFINELSKKTKVILVSFGNPYALKHFDKLDWIVQSYNEERLTQELTAQALFGVFEFKGVLPVSPSLKLKSGYGFFTKPRQILEYDTENPEAYGFNSTKLEKIDKIAEEVINSGSAPGCNILIVKDGVVCFQKAYGYHTYEKKKEVTTSDVYDLASITKIAATTVSIMKLSDEGKVNIYDFISKYIPELKGTNKENLIIRDIMVHQAGLQPWIPFYKNTVTGAKDVMPSAPYYSSVCNDEFCVPVANEVFLRKDYADSIWKEIIISPLRGSKEYKYSDLGFYMLARLIKNITNRSIDDYTHENFYKPLGMGYTMYNPKGEIADSLLVPTEYDRYFRMQILNGYVHDMGAAMLGGVSGHAGLFSSAPNLATLFQMLLNKGTYGGKRFLSEKIITEFTYRYPGSSRRGIGFDMKEKDKTKMENQGNLAPNEVYGHTGFTGGCVWVDPLNNMIFIMMTNRTYPTMDNNKFISGDYRFKVQNTTYEALKSYIH
jgi:beta-N-acetylhexosaminidase